MTGSKTMRERVTEYVYALQDQIVSALEAVDPNAPQFKRDQWVREQGGNGQSCVFAVPVPKPGETATYSQETVLEKGGVNVSVVHGMLPPAAIKQMRADHSSIPFDANNPTSLPFFAAGLSLVIHPRNPSAPTVHANYRYFELTEPPAEGEHSTTSSHPKVLASWFGGGSDLTPSYLFEEDAQHFHKTLKTACDKHGSALFPAFKTWCDEYFFITHRNEARGIGGIFFDDFTDEPHARIPVDKNGSDSDTRPWSQDDIFEFVKSCGDAFVPSYVPILERRKNIPTDEHKRRWQLLRRGRYVEFNLVYDRGTKFGLMTPGARVESILMSLPEVARWEYMSDLGGDGEDSEEGKLIEVLRKPREWA